MQLQIQDYTGVLDKHPDNGRVYRHIRMFDDKYGSCTMKEASVTTQLPMNSITWRFSDLERAGLIFKLKTAGGATFRRESMVQCSPNRKSIAWGVNRT